MKFQILFLNEILKSRISIGFIIFYLNEIQNHQFKYNSKSCISIKFQIIYFSKIQNQMFQLDSKSFI